MIRAFAIGLLAVLAVPSVASAQNATVSIPGASGYLYTGSPARDAFFLMPNTPSGARFDRNGSDAALMTAGSGCTDVFGDGTRIACSAAGGATINLNGGNDFFSGGTGSGMTINGGAGNDTVIPGGGGINAINGDAGDDTFNLATSLNRDVVNGGEGNDAFLYPRGGTDEFIGGAGVDRLELVTDKPSSISLDDLANDGPSNDLKYNVHSDVEDVTGSDGEDALTGSAAANVLDGAKGNDSIAGGAGADTLRGGDGDDQIEAKDGVADVVECGLGNDRATVDVIDTVSGCETVILPDNDGDGVTAPSDCDDANAAIRPGATDTPGDGIDQDCSGADTPLPVVAQPLPSANDFDHDGVLAGADCRDTDPAIRPGATDTPGDGIDQDCSGSDAPFPRLTAKLSYGYVGSGRNTILTGLELRELKNATIELRCTGCTARKKLTGKSGVVKLTSVVKGRKLRPGTVITVTISRPGYVTEVRRLTMRAKKKPTLTALCQAPGAAKPSAC